jgi:rhamnopyranosyl-N-acetylglucosaminyl-diphospho-decaprenol beta-1,3/1,4-galactofuranosyltransferase
MQTKLTCIIVTYNRLEKLKKALAAYAEQIEFPDKVVVVNNASTDGTEEFLDAWQQEKGPFQKAVLNLEDNRGPSGGFYAGAKKAIAQDAEWIWLADDDAWPEADTIARVKAALSSDMVADSVVAVCAAIYEDGNIALKYRANYQSSMWQFKVLPIGEQEYAKLCFPLKLFTYNGVAIRTKALENLGMGESNYFMYWDDFELSFRMSKMGKIICVPKIKIQHIPPTRPQDGVDWRLYYQVRNYYAFLKKHFPLVYRLRWNQAHSSAKLHMIGARNIARYNIVNKALEDARKDVKGLCKVYKPKEE